MGYICPDCGEGLPEDTPCPCTMAGGDFIDHDDPAVIRGPLTAEIASIRSPVRQFLGAWFTSGLRDLQRHYREVAPSLAVPGVDRRRPRNVGTAADWLLRFLVHPQPDRHLAMLGVMRCARAKINLLTAFAEIAESLGSSRSSIAADFKALAGAAPGQREVTFTGPLPCNAAAPEHLARCCRALALLTEGWRGGPMAVAMDRSGSSGATAASAVMTCSGSRHRPGLTSWPDSGACSRPYGGQDLGKASGSSNRLPLRTVTVFAVTRPVRRQASEP